MPKIGEVLYVKSTEEPVAFIASRKSPWYHYGTVLYLVRRPVVSDTRGIKYVMAEFLAEELETAEEQTHRLMGRMKSRQALAMGEFEPLETHGKKPS